jgi:hypothetical protein
MSGQYLGRLGAAQQRVRTSLPRGLAGVFGSARGRIDESFQATQHQPQGSDRAEENECAVDRRRPDSPAVTKEASQHNADTEQS